MKDNRSAAMLAARRLAGITPEDPEHVTHIPLSSVNKAAHSGFETQVRHYQKSRTGVSVDPEKELGSTNNFF